MDQGKSEAGDNPMVVRPWASSSYTDPKIIEEMKLFHCVE